MATLGLTLQPGTLDAPGCYPLTPQTLYAEMFSKGRALLGAITGVIVSEPAPSASDRDKLWGKLVGTHFVGVYAWDSTYNAWLREHQYLYPSGVRLDFEGTLAELATFDGGEATAVSAISGPMWEEDTNYAGRVAMGPGLIPDTATTLVVATNAGAGQHAITVAELPAHTHEIDRNGLNLTDPDISPPQAAASNFNGGTHANMSTEAAGGGQALSLVQPVRTAYKIKRTIRQYYRG